MSATSRGIRLFSANHPWGLDMDTNFQMSVKLQNSSPLDVNRRAPAKRPRAGMCTHGMVPSRAFSAAGLPTGARERGVQSLLRDAKLRESKMAINCNIAYNLQWHAALRKVSGSLGMLLHANKCRELQQAGKAGGVHMLRNIPRLCRIRLANGMHVLLLRLALAPLKEGMDAHGPCWSQAVRAHAACAGRRPATQAVCARCSCRAGSGCSLCTRMLLMLVCLNVLPIRGECMLRLRCAKTGRWACSCCSCWAPACHHSCLARTCCSSCARLNWSVMSLHLMLALERLLVGALGLGPRVLLMLGPHGMLHALACHGYLCILRSSSRQSATREHSFEMHSPGE